MFKGKANRGLLDRLRFCRLSSYSDVYPFEFGFVNPLENFLKDLYPGIQAMSVKVLRIVLEIYYVLTKTVDFSDGEPL